MGYQPSESARALDPFGMGQSTAQPLTSEEVDAARMRLKRFGLEDSMMGRANDWRGDMVDQRDALREQMRSSVLGSSTGGSALKDGASSALKSGAMASL